MIGRVDPQVARAIRGLHQSVDSRGRVRVVVPLGHPLRRLAYRAGWAWRNRLVLALVYGKRAIRHRDVDHNNRDRSDDRIRNLQALTRREHSKRHAMMRRGR